MRKLALAAALVAFAGSIAFAQQDMGNTPGTGATYTTGVVQALDDNSLTLKEDSNRVVTFLIVTGTVGAENHLVGSRVRVNFHHNENNQGIADEIQGVHGELETATVAVTPTPTRAPMPPVAEPTYTKRVVTPEPTTIPEPSVELEARVEPEPELESLPQGASPLASLGLLGLLSLGGALALRFRN